MYVIDNLGAGVPSNACFATTVQHLKTKAVELLVTGSWKVNRMRRQQQVHVQRAQRDILEHKLMPFLLDMRERQMADLLFQQSSLNEFIRKISKEKPDRLQKELASKDPLVRLLVVLTIGRRRLHLEKELIDCLNDPYPPIRDTTHQVLVRVARGTDFGPIPSASQRGIDRSIDKWKHWLALQQSASPETLAKNAAAGKKAKIPPPEIVPIVLVRDERSALSPELAKLSEELVNAKGDEQMAVLARLRDAKGIDNTDALALAIPKLSGDIKRQARGALVQRLTRMTAATLRDKLQDDNVEVRRAGTLACGRKNAKEHIADLLQLLDDPEKDVVQSARLALTELTGEDFGPASDADRRGRDEAAAAWRKWWKECQEKRK